MLIAALCVLGLLGLLWRPVLLAVPLAAAALTATLVRVVVGVARLPRNRVLTGFLFLLQPIARMLGRLQGGLTPWRRHGLRQLAVPAPRTSFEWSGEKTWGSERLEAIEKRLKDQGAPVRPGGESDRWDLEARGGLLGRARMRMLVEVHDGGAQLVRVRSWPRVSIPGTAAALTFALLSAGAAADGAWAAAAILAALAVVLVARTAVECGAATASVLAAIDVERSAGAAPAVGAVEVGEA